MRYEKGRKDESRRRIVEIASERFRSDGIAASGLAGIMKEAGLTNGAFYPHFPSKAALVSESVAATLAGQAEQIREGLAAGGLEAVIAAYLSPEHRDNPGKGCTSAALLPELARESVETRELYAERFFDITREMAAALPAGTPEPEAVALALQAAIIGTLQLARTIEGTALSNRILAAGADAARMLISRGGAVA